MSGQTALEVIGITKTFPGTRALDDVSLAVRKGEVHAVVGENGAGKSTLMKIIDGIHLPDCGEILVDGEPITIRNPQDAQRQGIGFVHQEIALCQHLSVAENVFMADINTGTFPLIPFNRYRAETKKLLEQFHAKIDPSARISTLSISNQQIVEIIKALSRQCRILIFDEPTAALTEDETDVLFEIIGKLKTQGISILYITHRMPEIFRLCDRVTILRDGKLIETLNVPETNEVAIVNRMVGRHIEDLYPPKDAAEHEDTVPVLAVENFGSFDRFRDISFSVYPGEILGLTGLVGAGRSEVLKAVCGLYPKTCGETRLQGKPIEIRGYRDAIRHGIVYLTEDRKSEGLFLRMNVIRNIAAMSLARLFSGFLVDRRKEANLASRHVESTRIRCSSLGQSLESLSGGNQQKVLLSKLLAIEPLVLFLDEPTRGIDVGAKSEIHLLLRNLANSGVAIVMISSDMPEVIGMCDRVVVMYEGTVAGTVRDSDGHLNEETLIHLASGLSAATAPSGPAPGERKEREKG